jgi:hypothetical protein
MIASWFDRGDQPSRLRAFALLAGLRTSSSSFTWFAVGDANAKSRMAQFGICHRGTRRARSPRLALKVWPISNMLMVLPATAMNLSPFAIGLVMARICRSTTSLTSTME